MMTDTAINTTNGLETPWSVERVDELTQMWADGMSAGMIAIKFGDLSRNAVIGKISRLGLPKRTSTSILPRFAMKRRADLDRSLTQRIRLVRRPVVQIKEKPQPAEFLAHTFDQNRRGLCWYPRGDGADMRFCGQRTGSSKKSFCSYCHSIVYRREVA
jgi:GcrA cell cycle regulator